MGILSWLFPSDADRLRSARDLMSRGRYEDARKVLIHCGAPEADGLYDECSRRVDAADAASLEKQARAAGFRGFRVEVSVKDPRARAQLEGLIAKELARAGVDLSTTQVDEAKLKAAIARAQQKARNKGVGAVGEIKLVPVMAQGR